MRPLLNDFLFIKAVLFLNLRKQVSSLGPFLLQFIFVIGNNGVLFLVWWIFFQKFKDIRGWTLSDISILYGAVTGAYGLVIIFAGGVFHLGRMILEGELDFYITQPKGILTRALCSSPSLSGFGDLFASFIFFKMSGGVGLSHLPVLGIALLIGALVLLCSVVIVQSLAFWVRSTEVLARQFLELTVLFSVYPKTLFVGSLQILLFSVIPSGFLGYLPADLIKDFSWEKLGIGIGAVCVYGVMAFVVFHMGLRKYESGSRFGMGV